MHGSWDLRIGNQKLKSFETENMIKWKMKIFSNMKWIFHFDSFDVEKINFHKGHHFCLTNFLRKYKCETFQFLVKFSVDFSLYRTIIDKLKLKFKHKFKWMVFFLLASVPMISCLFKSEYQIQVTTVCVCVCLFPLAMSKMLSKFSSMN